MLLYQFEISPFCDKVRRVLNLKGQAYDIENVSVARTLSGYVKKLNPAGKLPVLEIDGQRLADSTDIVEMLEQRFPEPPVYPADPQERARVHILEDWADESLYFYEVRLRFTEPHNAERWVPAALAQDNALMKQIGKRVMPGVMAKTANAQGVGRKSTEAVMSDLHRHLAALEAMLGGEWLVGNALSMADISVYVQLHCIAVTREGEALLADYPAVRDWMRRTDAATGKLA